MYSCVKLNPFPGARVKKLWLLNKERASV